MSYTRSNNLVFSEPGVRSTDLIFGPIVHNYSASIAASVSPSFNPSVAATARAGAIAKLAATGTFYPSPTVAATADYSRPQYTASIVATVSATFSPSVSAFAIEKFYTPTNTLVFGGAYTPTTELRFHVGLPLYRAGLTADASPTFSPSAGGTARYGYVANASASIAFAPQPTVMASAVYAQASWSAALAVSVAPTFVPTAKCFASYDSNVWRGIYLGCTARHSTALPLPVHLDALAVNSESVAHVQRHLSIDGYSVESTHAYTSLSSAERVDARVATRHESRWPVRQARALPWGHLLDVTATRKILTTNPHAASKQARLPYQHLADAHKLWSDVWVGKGTIERQWALPYARAVTCSRSEDSVYTFGLALAPGVRVVVPGPWNGPGLEPKYHPNNILAFRCHALAHNELRFCEPQCTRLTVPSRGVYIVSNSFSLTRVDNGAPLYAIAFNLSISADSWTWAWNAKVGGKQIADVLSTDPLNPIEVLATLNGTAFKLIVETIARDRAFNSDVISLSGRGTAAYLAAPYAPISTVFSSAAITAQQAANLALEVNNVSIGWDVDWGINDWLIAGNAFSSTGTYIEHLQRIAEAGGGYVQPAFTADLLNIRPYYPSSPWNWSAITPDMILPEDLFITEGIVYSSKPDYNGVYVNGGSSGGRLDLIKKTGTAGNVLAPTIVDPLATDAIMTRQRGLRVLGDTGRETMVTLKLPVMATGIILPGTMLRYALCGVDKIGIVRSTAVSYTLPIVNQNIEIESHEYL